MSPHLGITAHFIMKDWKQEQELVGFRRLSESHNGKNIAREIYKILKEDYDLIVNVRKYSSADHAEC
jgi:hypothetical protein